MSKDISYVDGAEDFYTWLDDCPVSWNKTNVASISSKGAIKKLTESYTFLFIDEENNEVSEVLDAINMSNMKNKTRRITDALN